MEDFTFLVLALFTSIALFLATKYSYWRRRNVPAPTPTPILGNYGQFFTLRQTIGATVQNIYNTFPDAPFVGAYFGTEPVLIPKDPEMIKTIMAKDFHKFSGRLLVEHEFRDQFASSNMFTASGDNWKALRQNFNPLFTSGKLKNFFGNLSETAGNLEKYLETLYELSPVQDFKDVATRYTLEAIGSTFFGARFEAMCIKESPFKNIADKIDNLEYSRVCKNNIREVWPGIYHFFSSKNPLFDGFDGIFYDMAQKTFQSRGYKQNGKKDFVDFLLKFREQGFLEGDGMKNDSGEAKRVKFETTDAMMASQLMVFFAAGFSTSSIALSFTLYEISKNFKIQRKLLDEIEEVAKKTNGDITYESIKDMKYLDMVITETLRMYPVLGIITREVMGEYKFVDYGLKVEKGLRIHIPVWAIHYDPKFYPEPHKYDPERFAPDQVSQRHPYTYLAFGEGHRICIGMRYAKMQVAMGLITILRKYTIETCEKTVATLTFDPKTFTIMADSPILLKMVRKA